MHKPDVRLRRLVGYSIISNNMYPTRHTQVNCVRVRVSTSLSFQCNTLQYRCQFVLFAKNICNNIHLLKPCRRCILINIILLINHVFVVRNARIPEYNECIEHKKCATDLRNKNMSYCPRKTLKKSSQPRKNPINVNILQALTVETDWIHINGLIRGKHFQNLKYPMGQEPRNMGSQ